MKKVLIILLSLLSCTCICAEAVKNNHMPVQPLGDIQTNNTTLIYSGIVNIPFDYFSTNSQPYTIHLTHVDTQSCDATTHTYQAKAVVSDTTASRNDHRVEEVCGLEGVSVQSASVVAAENGVMTVRLIASTIKGGWVRSGAVGFQTSHYCLDSSYTANSITGKPLMDHLQLDVYCVPNTVGE